MKKVLFLLLFLLVLGAAGTNAQVRIGGDGEPHTAAVLDLNADDSDTPTENKGALALPRISLEALSGEDANLNGMAPIAGMLVYNTNTTLGEGVYYWDGSQWVKPAGGSDYKGSASIVLSGDSLMRAALTGDVTAAANSNATTIANGVVKSANLADNAVTLAKISRSINTISIPIGGSAVGSCGTVSLPSGCSYGNTAIACNAAESIICGWNAPDQIKACRYVAGAGTPGVWYICLR